MGWLFGKNKKVSSNKKVSKLKDKNLAKELETEEKEKLNNPVIKDIDQEMDKVNSQHFNDLIEDPHVHSQGLVSTKQGVSVLFDDVVQNDIRSKEEKKKSEAEE